MFKRLIGVGLTASAIVFIAAPSHHAQQPVKIDFARDVQPILRQQCYSCHGPKEQKNGLRLDRRKDAMRGGTIAVIGPGNADGSRLYQRLIGDHFGIQMPPTGALPASQVAIIKQWIDQGAEWPDAASGEAPVDPPDPAAVALMDAIRAGDRRRVAAQLAAGGDAVRRKGSGGATPLMYATLYGDGALVRTLLENGADPNVTDEADATALMWAIPDLEKVTLLIDRGANVSARSRDGRTPLMIAAGLPGAAHVARLLIERGAKVRDRGASLFGDVSPLILAAYNGDEDMFRLLVEKGADLESDGAPALAFALRAQCKGCIDLVLPKLPSPAATTVMLTAAPPQGPALATPLLLAQGADVNARDSRGRTMLMLAAASDALPVDVVRMLIERGADVHAKSTSGETALGFARLRGRTPITELLETAGAAAGNGNGNGNGDTRPVTRFDPAVSSRAAVSRALPLLQQADKTFLAKSGCVSCHHNSLAALTVSVARSSGIAVNETIAKEQARAIGAYVESWRDRALQGIGIPGDATTVSYILLGLSAERHPADAGTDAMARFLKGQQTVDGNWRLLAHRPPIESSEILVTALSMRALQVYAPATNRAEYERSIRKAAEWIATAEARTNEDRAFQLLGLHWSKGKPSAVRAAAGALLALQRPDGGWAQMSTLGSDAYATGQALFALIESNAAVKSSPAYRKGVEFLLKTQLADGSWFVRSRALPIQPHFESGFPHGRDQFISAAGSNWAAVALARSH